MPHLKKVYKEIGKPKSLDYSYLSKTKKTLIEKTIKVYRTLVTLKYYFTSQNILVLKLSFAFTAL